MAKKRVPPMQATKTPLGQEAKTEDVPMRFMMPPDAYDELARQGSKVGLSKSSFAKMLIMEQIEVRKGGSK